MHLVQKYIDQKKTSLQFLIFFQGVIHHNSINAKINTKNFISNNGAELICQQNEYTSKALDNILEQVSTRKFPAKTMTEEYLSKWSTFDIY